MPKWTQTRLEKPPNEVDVLAWTGFDYDIVQYDEEQRNWRSVTDSELSDTPPFWMFLPEKPTPKKNIKGEYP